MKIGKFIGLEILGLSLSFSLSSAVFADGGDATLIHGCVAKDGTTRIVTPTTACKNSETARHWPTDARIVTDETRITNTENKNTTQDSAISAIQTKNTQQDAAIATLQGQVGGGSSGLVVKDSQGQVVGKLLGPCNGCGLEVVRQIGNTLVGFALIPSGLNLGRGVSFYYTTNNCTGTRYIPSFIATQSGFFESFQSTDGLTLYFSTLPAQSLSIQSIESFGQGADPSGVGACDNSFLSFESQFGTTSTISAASLGTPPFRLE